MYIQKTYHHTCGHTAYGPIRLNPNYLHSTHIHDPQRHQDPDYLPDPSTMGYYKTSIKLQILCPFCQLQAWERNQDLDQDLDQDHDRDDISTGEKPDITNRAEKPNKPKNEPNKLQSTTKNTPPGSGLLCVLLPHLAPSQVPIQTSYGEILWCSTWTWSWKWHPISSSPLPYHDLKAQDWEGFAIAASSPTPLHPYPTYALYPPYHAYQNYEMAYIPRPCGFVSLFNSSSTISSPISSPNTTGPKTNIHTSFKEKISLEEVMNGGGGIGTGIGIVKGSRMAGLMSQLRAAVRSGEMAARYG